MERRKLFNVIIIILISIICIIGIYKTIIGNIKLNRGKFRINDVILSCTTDVVSKTGENKHLSFDASQKNIFSFQIVFLEEVEILETYIDNISVDKKEIEIYINQKDREESLIQNVKKIPIDIQKQEDKSMLVEIEIVNKNIANNQALPDTVKVLQYDGRILKDVGINIEDINFTIEFTLNILTKDGTLNKMKVREELPKKEMLENGYYVERMNNSEFVFKEK